MMVVIIYDDVDVRKKRFLLDWKTIYTLCEMKYL